MNTKNTMMQRIGTNTRKQYSFEK